jgi:hypothetical protein
LNARLQEPYDPGVPGQAVANMDVVPLFFGVLRAAELAVQKWGLDVWVDLAKASMVNLSACDRYGSDRRAC